ncbi:hypothetical protein NHQ30_004518 [Ciborinia camelliae]|nr:hypothetical protein NHQ30_004518 [Ciborinia camelliae]
MQLPPPEIIATWPAPNYENPITRGEGVLVVNSILFPVVLLIILIRLYARLRISKSFGLDDWLIIAAMLPATTFAILAVLAEERFEFGRHLWDIKPMEFKFGLQFLMITEIIFAFGQTLTKCSMLAMLYRILSSGKRFKRLTIAATIIIAILGSIFITIVIFQCRPPSHYWILTSNPQPECINQVVHVTFAGSLNTLTDFVVVLFPIPKMLKLQIPRRQRLGIIFLFAAGFLVCIAGAVRTYYTYVELSSFDRTWDSYGVWISSCVELYVGIICASIPATKPFFKRYFFEPTVTSTRNNHYAISSADKGPFSGSNTSGTSRTSRTMQCDVELGDIREREMRTKGRSRNLDAIEEVMGNETTITSFGHVRGQGNRGRSSDDSKGTDLGIGMEMEMGIMEMRDGEISARTADTFDFRRSSKDELIDEVDIGMIPYNPHPRQSSR